MRASRDEPRDRVFTRFWRSGRRGGTGLGLYIVRGLVEAHGGRIEVGRAPGGGARFRFVLPAATPTSPTDGIGGRGAACQRADSPAQHAVRPVRPTLDSGGAASPTEHDACPHRTSPTTPCR